MKECSLWSPASRRGDGGTVQGVRHLPQTGYKIFDRYQECGIQGLTDRSRRPHHYAHKLPFQVENYILNLKHERPTWGARKIRERLIRRFYALGKACLSPCLSADELPIREKISIPLMRTHGSKG
jgi:hypothetical protein